MPPAKKAVAKKVATPAKKTAAKPVNKELEDFKAKVVQKIRDYRASGELCESEFQELRRLLRLEDELPEEVTITLVIGGDFTFERPANSGLDLEDRWVAEGLCQKIIGLLSNGLSFDVKRSIGLGNFKTIPVTITGKNVTNDGSAIES